MLWLKNDTLRLFSRKTYYVRMSGFPLFYNFLQNLIAK